MSFLPQKFLEKCTSNKQQKYFQEFVELLVLAILWWIDAAATNKTLEWTTLKEILSWMFHQVVTWCTIWKKQKLENLTPKCLRHQIWCQQYFEVK